MPVLPPPTNENFWLKRPTDNIFDDCCNEFWWISSYVAKGLARGQLPYANTNLDLLRTEVMRKLSWQTRLDCGFTINLGQDYKHLQDFVSEEDRTQLMLAWRMDCLEEFRNSFFNICELFN
ncbi:MAG: aminoglycoside 6-adenylyltransferase [Chloroflexi bacterium]|nr:aminoglycoside 6-adenylyltransferase [Chloroflexota bacterium]